MYLRSIDFISLGGTGSLRGRLATYRVLNGGGVGNSLTPLVTDADGTYFPGSVNNDCSRVIPSGLVGYGEYVFLVRPKFKSVGGGEFIGGGVINPIVWDDTLDWLIFEGSVELFVDVVTGMVDALSVVAFDGARVDSPPMVPPIWRDDNGDMLEFTLVKRVGMVDGSEYIISLPSYVGSVEMCEDSDTQFLRCCSISRL